MKVLKNILAVIGVILIIIFLIAMFSPADKKQSTPTYNRGLEKTYFRENFMEACVKESASYAYCSCSYNYLDSQLTDLELIEMDQNLEEGEITDVMWDAFFNCSHL